MRMSFPLKLLAVVGLALLLFVPLAMTQGLVEVRNTRQIETENQVARLTARPQVLVGPLLVVPFTLEARRLQRNDPAGPAQEVWEEERGEKVFVPASLDLAGDIRIEARRRGLYRTQVFRLAGPLKGRFEVPAQAGLQGARNLRLGLPFLALGIEDPRGILNHMVLRTGGGERPFLPGTGLAHPGSGVHAQVPGLDLAAGAAFAFEIPLELVGTRSLKIAPVAEETQVRLAGTWPAPSFEGGFAPLDRTWSGDGFTARWKIPFLSRDQASLLHGGPGAEAQYFGVAFLDPVNIYLQSERAVKYGFLFVLLTFGAFLLREMVRALPIHPFQYFLVGASLAVFFLLLLGLAEHLGFPLAYATATAANLALLATYLTAVLGSRKEAFAFTAGLGLLYAALYGLLASEDNALLLGSLLVFALLAAVMLGTRRMTWLKPGTPTEEG
ncbi:cell envelope integrity protein CreD [Mesoterricola sediminis]|uniref:Cell envelope integrity protein CreD n=1 Tax=Mesoterricola sediminis TaxID=2927980 RepID=A0AA48H1Q2_9BACT|nr:cell envelope integrity protein CreD [Mesoterricola sediminis]BDU78390.1 cell envelope integrity protein CreD [Mesoterricola sediminis]